ncbi:MAG: tail fiber domain-containing protein [Clostridium sp.]|uniref:tail fiber domain-containing protein n=1 Tax=Clostridium sp. TaxID=1506 RepID=UPI00305893BE
MALVLSGSHSSGPSLLYELYADQTAGSGTNRTIKLTLKLKCGGSSSSWYGYPMDWRGYVNGTWSSWAKAKGTESWRGGEAWRSYTWSYTTNVGTTSSKSITVGFGTNSYSGDDSWDSSKTGTFTVGSTNSAPKMSGYITLKEDNNSGAIITNEVNGTENLKKVRENLENVYLSWPSASDAEGGTITYDIYNQQNESAWSKIASTTATNYTHKIGAGNQGRSYDYEVFARDTGGLTSNGCNGTQFQKNVLTGSSLASSSKISYDAATILFTWSNPINTNGSKEFDFILSADGITVNRGTVTDEAIRSLSIAIVDTAPSTGTYILRKDIINKFRSTGHKGTLNFTLTTKNGYGSTSSSTKGISVDMRVKPTESTNITIDKVASTALMVHSVTKGEYYIPDVGRKIKFKWTAGVDKLGGAVTYTIQSKFGSGSYNTIKSGLTSLEYDYVIPKQSIEQQLIFRVITLTDFGYESAKDSTAITLHYYNNPNIAIGNITRTEEEALVPVIIKSATSIQNINTIGNWTNKESNVDLDKQVGELTATQGTQNLKLTALEGSKTYLLTISYNDDSGFMKENKTEVIQIGVSEPVFSITKYGVGIGGTNANSNTSLNVKGSIGMAGEYLDPVDNKKKNYNTTLIKQYSADQYGLSIAIGAGGPLAIGGGESARAFMDLEDTSKSSENTYITSDSNIELIPNCNTITNRKRSVLNTSGNLHISGNVYANYDGSTSKKCWDTSDLPSPTRFTKVNNSTYWGLGFNESNESNWIRTTINGFIPNKPNDASGDGGSSIGTTSWRFRDMWATNHCGTSFKADNTILDKDKLVFSDENKWKSIDLYRGNTRASFGVGSTTDGFAPAIESYRAGETEFKSRIDLCPTALKLTSVGTDQSCWMGFYSGQTTNANRIGYIGRGSNGNTNINLMAEKGGLVFRSAYNSGANGFIADSSGYFRQDDSSGRWDFGHPSYRWLTVYYHSLNAPSDYKLKENIKYIRENDKLRSTNSATITTKDFYNFIRNDLSLAQYDYKTFSLKDDNKSNKGKNKIGFIAQDIVGSKIGKILIQKDKISCKESMDDVKDGNYKNKLVKLNDEDDVTLSYDLTDYVSILAGALKESIVQIESLKLEVENLKDQLL